MHAHTNMHTHTHIHKHTQTHTYIHIHTHTQDTVDSDLIFVSHMLGEPEEMKYQMKEIHC